MKFLVLLLTLFPLVVFAQDAGTTVDKAFCAVDNTTDEELLDFGFVLQRAEKGGQVDDLLRLYGMIVAAYSRCDVDVLVYNQRYKEILVQTYIAIAGSRLDMQKWMR